METVKPCVGVLKLVKKSIYSEWITGPVLHNAAICAASVAQVIMKKKRFPICLKVQIHVNLHYITF